MERAPGLAPGKSGFAIHRLDAFGIARLLIWGWPPGVAPGSPGSQPGTLLLSYDHSWFLVWENRFKAGATTGMCALLTDLPNQVLAI